MRRTQPALLIIAFTAIASLGLSGCDALRQAARIAYGPGGGSTGGSGQVSALNPNVTVTNPILTKKPAPKALAAHYCPQLAGTIPELGIAGPFACMMALGDPPPTSSLAFEFGNRITISNPNDIPIPALDVLVAITLFPGRDAEALGAVCLSFCGGDDPLCDGSPRPGACSDSRRAVRSIDDLADRVPSLIHGIATGQTLQQLQQWRIPAGGDVTLNLTFALGVNQALAVIRKTVDQLMKDAIGGGQPTLNIPVSFEGTVFFDMPVIGAAGVGFGPITTTWTIK